MPVISVKKLDERAVLPTYGSEFAAGADLYAVCDEELVFQPNETKFVKTGLAMEIPEGYAGLIYARSGLACTRGLAPANKVGVVDSDYHAGLIYARSGLACKRGLAPANKVGVVDSDYRGEVMVALHNHSDKEQRVAPGERIAQLVVAPFLKASFEETQTLNDTVRGEGGFGSTGRK